MENEHKDIKKEKEREWGGKEKNRMENEKKDVKGSVCEKRWGV